MPSFIYACMYFMLSWRQHQQQRANGNGFTVIGNIYDNPEFAEAARHNIA